MANTAQMVADLFDGDGSKAVRGDLDLGEEAKARKARIDREGYDAIRYTFPDGSIITQQGGAWDFGFADCWCWQGGGHTEECDKRRVACRNPEAAH